MAVQFPAAGRRGHCRHGPGIIHLSGSKKMQVQSCVRSVVAVCLAWAAFGAQAQPVALAPAPQNVVQLAASASVEVAQDWLVLTLSTTREGPDPDMVQAQLKQALDTALAQVRPQAKPGQLDVRSGNFHLSPRYNREGRITGWQGSAALVLEGRDFRLIAALAGRIQTLSVAGVQFSLSREEHRRAEAQVQAAAIERFKAKAVDIAKDFGFTGYGLREVSVQANDQEFAPRPPMMAMQAKAAIADAPVPLEAGRSSVTVTVSGSVQLK
jgi:predicted secreted protein